MADLLLPTQQVNLSGGNAHGVQSRFTSPTPDKGVAFSVDPNRSINMMKDAVDAITKHLEDVQKEKQDSLVNQASNLYQEAVAEETNRYKNTYGENAVKGFDEVQENISAIDKEFSKIFKNGQMQSSLDKLKQNTTLNARLNARNWHDKQVYEFAKQERMATLEATSQNFVQNMGTPNDKNNLTQMQYALDDIIQKDHGVLDKNSDLYKQLAETYYDKAFKSPLGIQIQKNPSMARVNIERVKGLISQDLYDKLMLSVRDEQKKQYAESLQIEKLKTELQNAKEAKLADFMSREMNYAEWDSLRSKYDTQLKEAYAKEHNIKVDDIPQNDLNLIAREAKERADADKDDHDTTVYQWNNTNARMIKKFSGQIGDSLENNAFNRDAPLDCLDTESRLFLIDRLGSEEKAEKFVKDRAIELFAFKDSTGGDKFFSLTKQEQAKLYSNPRDLNKFFFDNKVSMKDRYKIDEYGTKLIQQIKDGQPLVDKPVLAVRDHVVKIATNYKKYTDIDDVKDVQLVDEFINKVQQTADKEYQKTKDLTVYSDSHLKNIADHIRVYDLPKMKNDIKEIDELVDLAYDVFKGNSDTDTEGMYWNKTEYSKDERKQLLKEKIVELRKANGNNNPTLDSVVRTMVQYGKDNKAQARRFFGANYWGDVDRNNSLFNWEVPEEWRLRVSDSQYHGGYYGGYERDLTQDVDTMLSISQGR